MPNIQELFPPSAFLTLAKLVPATPVTPSVDRNYYDMSTESTKVTLLTNWNSDKVTCKLYLKSISEYPQTSFNPTRPIAHIAKQVNRFLLANSELIDQNNRAIASNEAYKAKIKANLSELYKSGIKPSYADNGIELAGSARATVSSESVRFDYLVLSVEQTIQLQSILLKVR